MKKLLTGMFIVSLAVAGMAAETGTNVGDMAPTFSLKSVDGKTNFDLASFKGKKAVFVNIFNTWCGPCIKETPDMVKIYPAYKNKVEFVSICTPWRKDTAEKASKFAEKFSMPWAMVFDESGEVTKNYDVMGVPTNAVVSKEGNILFYLAGGLSEENMKKVLDAAAEGKSPELPGLQRPARKPKAVATPAVAPMKEGDPWVGVSLGEGLTRIPADDKSPQALKDMAKKMEEAGQQVSILKVVEGGPAEKAGLKSGQIVASVDGQKVSKVEEVIKLVRSRKVGDVAIFEIREALGTGEPKKIKVTVGAYAPQPVKAAE